MLAGGRPCVCLRPIHPRSISDADQEQIGGTFLCETHPEKCKQLIVNSTGLAFSEAEQGGRWGNRDSYRGFGTRRGKPESHRGKCDTLQKGLLFVNAPRADSPCAFRGSEA